MLWYESYPSFEENTRLFIWHTYDSMNASRYAARGYGHGEEKLYFVMKKIHTATFATVYYSLRY